MIREVIFIESASEMGGVEFSTLYLASHLSPKLWAVTVVCPQEGTLSSACRKEGVQVEIVPMSDLYSTSFRVGKSDTRLPNVLAWVWNGFSILATSNRLQRFLAQRKPDLVVTKGLYAHLCGGLAAKEAGVKCIWHVQDFISERFGGLYRIFFGLLARIFPDEIVVDGRPIAQQFPLSIKNRVSVVFNGIDVQVFRPNIDEDAVRQQFAITPDNLIIGHAARITPWKGQHHLLEAFGKIAKRYPQTRLLLVGAPTFDNNRYEQKLRARTEELGLSRQVVFTGFRMDLPDVLSSMDIFAYPSVEKDTSPLVLLSAMACGLPVVAFDIDGVREVLGETGMLIPVRDECKMADALEKLIQDSALRSQMGIRSRQKAVASFSLEQYVAGMEAVFVHDWV